MHDLKLQILHFKVSPVVTAEELVLEIDAIVVELPVKVLVSILNKLDNSVCLCTVYCLSQMCSGKNLQMSVCFFFFAVPSSYMNVDQCYSKQTRFCFLIILFNNICTVPCSTISMFTNSEFN